MNLCNRCIWWITLAGLVLTLTAAVAAGPNPSDIGGSLLRDIEHSTGKQALAPAPLLPAEKPPAEAPLPQQAGQTVLVSSFHIKATRFPEEELRSVIQAYVGRALTLSELQEAARKLGEYYRQHDYLAHAYLPPQTVRNGVVEIVVVEGRLGQVKVDPSSTTRLNHDFATDLVRFRAGIDSADQWLHPSELDEAVMILSEVPGVHATSTLAPGATESESTALLKVGDGPLLNGSVTFDRAGSHSTGADRALASASVDDPFGRGEQFSAMGLKTAGSTYGRLAAVRPVGVSGLTVGINGTSLEYNVGGVLTPLNLNGFAWTVGLTAAYPIRRSTNFSLTASATLDHKRMVDWANNSLSDDKRIEVGTFGFSAMTKDGWMGGGTNRLGATLSLGQLDLSRGPPLSLSGDQATKRTNGTFGKLLLTAAREQPLNNQFTLAANFQAQASYPNLDSSEQFSLGGQDGIRAYPTSEASGDEGWLSTFELRWQAAAKTQLVGFYDIGGIHQHTRPWSNWQTSSSSPDQPNDYLLQGIGVGATWFPVSHLQIKASVAHTIGNNPGRDQAGNDSDGYHRQIRAWIQAVVSF